MPLVGIFFFKQKPANEMRISDWSSDVCSSDLITGWRERSELRLESSDFAALSKLTGELLTDLKMGGMDFAIATPTRKASEDTLLKEAVSAFKARAQQIGRASCRERVCKYV